MRKDALKRSIDTYRNIQLRFVDDLPMKKGDVP